MSWTAAVLRLQKVDLELTTVRGRLQEVAAALQDDAALRTARQRAQEKTITADVARKAQKDLEFELGRVETKHQQKETRLYGGAIRNSRELEDLQAKVQSLRRRKSQIEDKLLEAMLTCEEAEAEEQQAAARLQDVEQQWQQNHETLSAERDSLRARIATLEAESAQHQGELPASVLDSYHYLQPRKGGISVARLQGDICSVCGIKATSQRKQSAQAGRETYCDGCGRLLVL
jgi:predicted  nucleic acid-binding Zn-ribbon protein